MPTEPIPERDTEGAEDRAPENVHGGNTDQLGTGSEGSRVAGTPVEHLEGDRRGGAKAKVPDDAGSRGKNATSTRKSNQGDAAADPADREQLVALGARLRQLRHARGYKSQLAFVLEAGLPRSYYGDIERGQTNPTIHTLLAIAKALNVPLYALFAPSDHLSFGQDALDDQAKGTSGTGARTSEAERRHPSANMQEQPIAPFPFLQAQRRFRSRHPKMMADRYSLSARPRIKGGGSAGSVGRSEAVGDAGESAEDAEGAEGAVPTHSEDATSDTKARKPSTRRHRGGTLVSTAAAARAFGVNLRTIERWVEARKLLPWDWVDGRLVVFKREEIEAIAKEYHQYLVLRDKVTALRDTEGAGEYSIDLPAASKALKRLLKRYKRKRAPRASRPTALTDQAGETDRAGDTAEGGSAC